MNEQQALALFEAKESLRAAVINLEQGLPKIAASRAYYSMFYAAQAFLATTQLSFRKHSAVVASFGEQFAATDSVPREFHRFLIEAQNARKFLELADAFLGGMS